MSAGGAVALKLSPHATYGAHKRHVQALRKAVSDYDAQTDILKRKVEREAGPAARFAVDRARSPRFHELYAALVEAERQFASWKPSPKKRKLVAYEPFSAMIARAINSREPRP